MIVPLLSGSGIRIKIMEGMAMGKATIGSRTGGIAEVIEEGKSGILFEPGNGSDLAEKIESLLDDINRRMKLSQEAVKRAREFTWDKNADRVAAIYEDLMGKPVTY